MNRLFISLALTLSAFVLNAQTISITANQSNSPQIVVGSVNTPPNTTKYHVSEQLYSNAEIGNNFTTAGTAITQINFYLKDLGSPTSIGNYKVSMQNISASTTTLTTGSGFSSGYTVVFNGTLDATPVDGFVKIPLTTSFVRTAGTNLVVKLERLNGISHPGFAFYTANGNQSSTTATTCRRANINTVPTSSTSLSQSAFRPAIQFIHTYNLDAAITDFTFPAVSCFNSNQQIQVALSNQGTDNITPGSATVTLQVNGVNTYSSSLQNGGIILPGEFELFNFTGISLNNPGNNQIKALVVMTGDANQINDTLVQNFITATSTSSFPITENFEGASPNQFIHFEALAGARNLWVPQTGAYNNNDLDPNSIIPRSPGNKYYLFNNYDFPNTLGYVSRMYSNCITMPSVTSTTVPVISASFWMSHDNTFLSEEDSLYVSISTDRGNSWTRLAGFIRPEATATTPYWKREVVDLTPYAGQTVQLAFEGVSAQGNAFGLDDVEVSFSYVVPVSLLDFDVKRVGKANQLNWTTEQEINVDRFEIEFSNDGKNFKSIGNVSSTNQTGKQTYRFIDNRSETGVHYYRIKMVDRDQKFSMSGIKTVRNLGYANLSIFPNPVNDRMQLILETESNENAQYHITDLSGRRVQTGRFNFVSGENQQFISWSNLPKGTYILSIQLSNETLIKKVNKL